MKNNDPLHILLTNDDGHEAPGIRALQRVLKRAGHRVSMVAPSTEQSATSMGVTSRRNLTLEQIEHDSWHLDGQPADTVLVALRHLLEENPPDLVLSGINFGPNVGTALYMSGTIGAAIMASLNGVPAIAVSAGMRFEEVGTEFPSTLEVLEPAAEFICSVVDSLRASVGKSGRLLPKKLMLNINYPPLPKDQIKGVLHPQISAGHIIDLAYHRCDETGLVVPRFLAGVDPSQPQKQDGDVRAHMEGFITISAVKPRWNPPNGQAKKLRKRMGGLELNFLT
jgi:5'/3'-nucleotidase SurE